MLTKTPITKRAEVWISSNPLLASKSLLNQDVDSVSMKEFLETDTFLDPCQSPHYMLVKHATLPPFCGGPPSPKEITILYRVNYVQRKPVFLNIVLHVTPLCHYSKNSAALKILTAPSSYTISNFLAWSKDLSGERITFYEKDPTL